MARGKIGRIGVDYWNFAFDRAPQICVALGEFEFCILVVLEPLYVSGVEMLVKVKNTTREVRETSFFNAKFKILGKSDMFW
ncbi:MAG TPA: hypothetical protein VHU84_13195 [Lacipirellulaceae bacterium]|jgi:hypothetical protein|nr:hypothetical protein [Lacipirellulaceae bacterium]